MWSLVFDLVTEAVGQLSIGYGTEGATATVVIPAYYSRRAEEITFEDIAAPRRRR